MLSKRIKDLTGQKYGRLLVIEYGGHDGTYRATWVCLCDCGKTCKVTANRLKTGVKKSCGCLNDEVRRSGNNRRGKTISNEARENIRRASRARSHLVPRPTAAIQSNIGRSRSEKTKRKISAKNGARGTSHNFYKDGKSRERMAERQYVSQTIEYKLWRAAVFNRDRWICQECGSNKRLNADHIKPWADYPELRYDVDNGRTLCWECHRKTPTFGNYRHKKQPVNLTA